MTRGCHAKTSNTRTTGVHANDDRPLDTHQSRPLRLVSALLALALATASALAQNVLPRPEEPFAGKIGTTFADSVAAFPAPVTAPAGAPNVMLVLTDDVGFGAVSTFGGAIPTPHLDRLAARAALQPFPHHRDVLAHACVTADRA